MSRDPQASDEWVGGHFVLDDTVTDDGPPYHPSLVAWMDPTGPVALKGKLVRPGDEVAALVKLLADACAHPDVGPPRRPGRVRVADELAARRIRERHGIPAAVGPTPELDDLRRSYAEHREQAGDDYEILADGTYLPDGVSPAEAAELFKHGRRLYALAPWEHIDDEDVLAVDVPAQSVHGAMLSLIGGLGDTLGFVLFESAAAFSTFLQASDPDRVREGRPDLGSETLTLTFEPEDALPEKMLDEVTDHRFVRTEGVLFPLVLRRSRHGEARQASAEDLRLAIALTQALVKLFEKHPPRKGLPETGLKFQSQQRGGVTVTLSHPAPGAEVSDQEIPPEMALLDEVFEFGAQRFPEVLERAHKAYGLGQTVDPIELQLFPPWFAFCYRTSGGEPLAEHFLRQRGEQLPVSMRDWLRRQLEAPLSVWEVEEIRRGEGLTLRDLFTGRSCRVLDKLASEDLRLRDGLLGRVVPDAGGDDTYRLYGVHALPLPPRSTAAVVAEMARRAGWQALPIDPKAVGAGDSAEVLVRLWRDQLRGLEEAPPPQLCNTDGDPLLMVEDTYDLDGRDREQVVAALLDGGFESDEAAADQAGEQGTRLTLNKRKRGGPLDVVLVAMVRVHDDRLVVETNSRKRAATVRRKLTSALGAAPTHRRRSETNPTPPRPGARSHEQETTPAPDVPPEALELLREMKTRHWERWLDEPVPALGGVTPRQAAGMPERRPDLELLLKEAEHAESGQGDVAIDLAPVRRELGMGDRR